MIATIKLSLPVGLLVVYVLGALIWYELLRAELVDLLGRRRRTRERRGRRGGGSCEAGAPVDGVAAGGAAEDEARTHYLLEREAASAERDAAVEAAQEATRKAIERIERRYGRVGSAVDDRERTTAKAERDAAVEAARQAAKQAVARIERRYREIDWALEDEEDERIRAMLERANR